MVLLRDDGIAVEDEVDSGAHEQRGEDGEHDLLQVGGRHLFGDGRRGVVILQRGVAVIAVGDFDAEIAAGLGGSFGAARHPSFDLDVVGGELL